MPAVLVPRWLTPLLRAAPRARPPRARAILDAARPWDEVRRGLASAVLVDPAAARPALVALQTAAARRHDPATGARLRMLEGRAIHRAGRIDEALAAYAEAEKALRAAGLLDEALSVGVSRIDALATAGHVSEALSLARRLARGFVGKPASNLSASLEVNRGQRAPSARRRRRGVRGVRARREDARRRSGSVYLAGVARLNGGVALLESGDVDAAVARFEAAVDDFRARGLTDLEREARYNLAWGHVHAGRLGEGIRGLQALADEHKAAGLLRREALCRMDLADALGRAGDLAGGEREALRAAASFASVGALAERAEALWFAASAAAPGAVSRALEHLVAAKAAARRAGRPSVSLRCDVLRADLASRAGGRGKRAGAELARLERRARALGQRSILADVLLLRAAAALDAGRGAEARRRFEAVLASSGGRPWIRAAAETGIARADARDPRRVGAALVRLRKVARFLDGVRTGLPGSWLRAQFVAERLDPYLSRVDLLLARDRPADRREAEALLESLAARRFLAARPPVVAADRLARIRARLEALYDRLARGEGPTRGADGGFAVEAVARAPGARVGAVDRPDLAPHRASRRVRPGRRGSRAAPRAPRPRRGPRPSLAPRRSRARARAHRGPRGAGGRPRLVRGPRGPLPLAPDPGAPVGLPARARPGGDRPGRRRARARAALRPRPAAARRRPLARPTCASPPTRRSPTSRGRCSRSAAVGSARPAGCSACPPRTASPRRPRPPARPARAPSSSASAIPTCPASRAEIAAIARAAGAVRVVRGADATRAAVAHALATAKVVHLAGHGWEAGEVPPLGGVRVADGWFTSTDLPPDGVAADLVVLAACRTGGGYGRTAVAWGGLVPALLAAGVRRVLWTLDDVDDSATAHLMTLFHRTRAAGDDLAAFGSALSRGTADAGHAGAVLAFRLSGVSP